MEIIFRKIVRFYSFIFRVIPPYYFLCLIFFYSSFIPAQNIRFKNLSAIDGLSHNSVTAFCQDKFGFIWIGTADGLNKFDGNRFTVYRNDLSDSTSISDNSILSLYEDKEGILWVGTENGGLNRFDPRTEIFKKFVNNPNDKNSISFNNVTSITSDKAGNLWIGTKQGLNKLAVSEKNKNKPVFINYLFNEKDKNSITSNVIYSLLYDSKGSLWLSLSDGYGIDKLDFTDASNSRFSKTNFSTDKENVNSIIGNWVLYVFEDSKGRIWISSWGGGLTKYEPEYNKFTRYKNNPADKSSLSSNYTEMVLEDNTGTIWIANFDGGLNRLIDAASGQPEHFVNYKFNRIDPYSLPDNRATILFKDKSGLIWIGTLGHGFSRFNPQPQFYNFGLINEDHTKEYLPSAMLKASDGNLWVGTFEGVLFRIGESGRKVNRFYIRKNEKYSTKLPFISSLFEDEEKTIWITTTGKGIFYIPKNSASSPLPKLYPMVPIKGCDADTFKGGYSFIREDSKKNLIIGTTAPVGTLLMTREEKLKGVFNLKKFKSIPYPWVFENDGQNFWIGSFANGIVKIDGNKFAEILRFSLSTGDANENKKISNNDIYTILKTKDNSIWFGTFKSLSQVKPNSDTLIHYQFKDGLANETVYGILEDDYNNLWISTYNGLSKMDLRTKLFTNFYREDGIQANEFIPFSYYKDPNGLLYFGGINGVTVVNPKIDVTKIQFPELKITGLYISNTIQENKNLIKDGILKESFNFANQIDLPYNKNAFTVEFSALEYNSPQKIKYMYMLEGYNDEWVNLRRSTHSVNFMNLEPNTYILKILSTNKDGIWNPVITELKIVIKPPFWRTWWFNITMFLLAAGIIGFTYQYRIRSTIKRQKVLQQMVDDQTLELRERNADLEAFSYSVSHDLRTPLRSIYSFSQIITEDFGHQLSAEAKSYFDKITKAAFHMTDLIDGILKLAQIARSDLNKKNVNISKIAESLIEDLKKLYPENSITVKIQPDICVNGDLILLTTVIENLLSNAIKFSAKNNEIMVEMGKTRAFDRMKTNAAEVIFIKDNGVGFDMKYSEKLFQVFQRLHTSQEFGGTGIGLANVKKIISRHGGVIWAESEIDKGTTFFFTLP